MRPMRSISSHGREISEECYIVTVRNAILAVKERAFHPPIIAIISIIRDTIAIIDPSVEMKEEPARASTYALHQTRARFVTSGHTLGWQTKFFLLK